MSALTFGHNWENITSTVTGAGSVVVTDEILTCSSISGDNSKAVKYIYLQQGDAVRVSMMARITSGTGPIGGVAISNPSDKARVFADSTDWQRIECTYSLPMTATKADTVTINVGVFTSDSGTIEFSDPKIDIFSSTIGHNRTIAQGFITLASGVAGINTGYTMSGILGVNYNSVTFELEVTMPKSTGAIYSSPLFFIQNNDSGVAAARNILVRQSGYTPSTGVATFKFYDLSTNLNVDVASIASMFIFFKAEII